MSRRELVLNSRRLVLSGVLAVAIHAGLYFAIPAILRLESRRQPDYGGTVLVQLEEPAPVQEIPVVEPPPPQPQAAPAEVVPPVEPQPAPSPAPAPVVKTPAPSPKPAPAPKPAASKPAPAPAAKITQPLAAPAPATPVVPQPQPQPALPKTPTFRASEEKTGVPSPLPPTAPVGTAPAMQAPSGPDPSVAAAGKPSSGSPSAPSVQRSGVAQTVPAQPGKSTGTSTTGQTSTSGGLDLGALDKMLASGSSSSAAPRTATTGTGTRDFSLVWDTEEGKDRKLEYSPDPVIPKRVQEQGLTLTLVLSITVTPLGLVQTVRVTRPSGDTEVDNAVVAAVRTWRFSPAETTRNVTGSISPYTIRPR
jgi:TonB family protein